MFAIVSVISSPETQSSGWESELETDTDEKKKRKRKIKRRKPGDPVFGENCHWCKRETLRIDHVKCSRCPLRFCGGCLRRRHGEDVEEEMQENVRWVCPICRGGCGTGCRISCCNCGPCRKYQQLEPAGRIVPAALKAGFSNVHDYLVHFETGEPPEVIARRKEGRGWTKATGAIDPSVRMGMEDSNLCWAMKRMRTSRRRLVARLNSKWGNQTIERCKSDNRELMVVARLDSNWGNETSKRCIIDDQVQTATATNITGDETDSNYKAG